MDGGGDEVTLCSLISLLKTEHPEKLASKPALSFPHPTVQDIESLESYPDLGVETISGLEKHNTGDSAFRPQHSTISSSENTVNNRRTPVAGFGKHSVLPPKSCLTRVVLQTPAKPNQKKKTVAFGKTVNVSQTVEGTSRLAKQKAEMNKYSKTSPAEVTNKENNDPTTIREDQQKLSSVIDTTMEMKESIQVLTRQIQENEKNIEILKKEKEEMHKEILETKAQIEKLGNILTGYVEMTLPDKYSGEKEQAFPRIINSRKNEKVQKGKIPHYEDDRYESAKSKFDVDTDLDSLTLAELRRLMDKNPVFRQYVADIRAEEEEERKNYRIKQNKLDWDKNDGRQGEKCMQRTVEREAWQKDEDKRANNRRGATITQKFTVERSIHCSPSSRMSPYSVDTNHFLSDRGVLKESDVNAYDDVQSIYQPGESISYHPQRYKSSRYTVQSPSDEERRSDIERRRDRGDRDETAAEERRRLRRERRAKQKF